jgi:hypothetical protein
MDDGYDLLPPIIGYLAGGKVWHPSDVTIVRQDDGYDLLAVRIRRDVTVNGAIVALCPDEQGVVTADVCIDGPPVP